MSTALLVHEIYLSLQGESTWAGLPCVFVRLTGCPLRCSYCDTAHAFRGGRRRGIGEVVDAVGELAQPYGGGGLARLPLVELTGGEPLAQAGAFELMRRLCDVGYTVLLETSGALGIGEVDARVRRIVDFKSPSSGEVERNDWENVGHLRATDEVKFVLGTREDYVWAREVLAQYGLARICPVLFSWATPLEGAQRDPSLKSVPAGQTAMSRVELAERVVADALPVRFQLQMHKFIWPADRRGV